MREPPQASLYKNDFASWGKSNGKLVFGRPEEKYYPMNFVGKVQTSQVINNDRTQALAVVQQKLDNEKKYKAEILRL
jgi:hypothetical protein